MKLKVFTLILILLLIAGCNNQQSPKQVQDSKSVLLGLESRNFYVGTSGFGPRNFPEFNINDLTEYWNDIELSGDIYGIHTNWTETKIIKDVAKNTDVNLEVVLGFQKPSEWKDSVEQFIQSAETLLTEIPDIKYLAIGNEVNILYEEHQSEFPNFISAYKRIYSSLKSKFPNIKIFTVFQYEALLGKGYLTGKMNTRKVELILIDQFKEHLDLIGLTMYPSLDYKSPSEVSADYLSSLNEYDLPIGITETGWMSRERFGGKLEFLNEAGYTGSQTEQKEFLLKILEISKRVDLEFVNWFFINDFTEWEEGDLGTKGVELFDSAGLRLNDGSEKVVWQYWLDLRKAPYKN